MRYLPTERTSGLLFVEVEIEGRIAGRLVRKRGFTGPRPTWHAVRGTPGAFGERMDTGTPRLATAKQAARAFFEQEQQR